MQTHRLYFHLGFCQFISVQLIRVLLGGIIGSKWSISRHWKQIRSTKCMFVKKSLSLPLIIGP